MSSQEIHNRRKDDHGNWFVRAGGWTRSAKFVATVFGLLLAGSLLFQFTAARDDAQQAQDTLDQLASIGENAEEQRKALVEQARLILDCTKAGGDCFEKAQEQTASIVANLNIVTQYSVICGEREDGEEAILNCVNREVKDYLKVSQQGKNG